MGIVENTNKKINENDKYYFASLIDSQGYVYQLLLTEREFNIAVERGKRNPEDITENFIVLQGIKDKEKL